MERHETKLPHPICLFTAITSRFPAALQKVVGTQVVTSHITHTGTGRHKGRSRNRPTASPSYHGRRGATKGKTPTASPGSAGQPHQVTQCHHIGPTPPHTGDRLDSHQCQRGTGYQSHHGHGAHPAHHCDRHWSLCRPRCQAHLALGQSTNRGGAPRPTPGGLVRDTHAKPPKYLSRVGRGGSWKQRHLSQIGEGVRLHTENGVCFCTVHT